jgi:hypothetical protein
MTFSNSSGTQRSSPENYELTDTHAHYYRAAPENFGQLICFG